jgi:hypothetical protein
LLFSSKAPGARPLISGVRPMKLVILVIFTLLASACSTPAPPRPDLAGLHPKLQKIYANGFWGPHCKLPIYCGDLVSISCAAELDGPHNYYNNKTASLIMSCGGSCMVSSKDPKVCQACPPKEWTCANDYN